jgi:hypothetical protein
LGLLSIRAVDSLPGTGRTTLITIGQRIPHGDLIGLLIYRHPTWRVSPQPTNNAYFGWSPFYASPFHRQAR